MYTEKIESLLYRMEKNDLHCTSLKFNSREGVVLFMREIEPYKEVTAKENKLQIKITRNYARDFKRF